MENLLEWQQIEEILNKSEENSVLLGNGFSRSYDAKSFNQASIINEMESLKGKNNVEDIEKCIQDTQNIINEKMITPNTASKEAIDKWIRDSLHKEFIEKLFDKMPQAIKDKNDYDLYTLKPYKKFLSNFNSFYTLNYDPLLYWMSMHFKAKGEKDILDYLDLKTELAQIAKEDKKYETKSNKMAQALGKAISNLRTKNFKKCISNEDYMLKLYYNGKLVLEKPVIKADAENIFDLEKASEMIYNSLSDLSNEDETVKCECEKIDNTTNKFLNEKIVEIKVNDDGLSVPYSDGFKNNENKESEWGSKNPQKVYFIHGAFHLLEKDNKTFKIKAEASKTMLKTIKDYWDEGFDSLTILEGGAKKKIDEINKHEYLKNCFEKFNSLSGHLVTFGVSFMESDEHIIKAINDNSGIENVFIGCFNEGEAKHMQEVFKNNSKVKFYITEGFFNIAESDKKSNESLLCMG
jgi:hypothetical protein